jgi:hypothetical protein
VKFAPTAAVEKSIGLSVLGVRKNPFLAATPKGQIFILPWAAGHATLRWTNREQPL